MKKLGTNKVLEDRNYVLRTIFNNSPLKEQDNYLDLLSRLYKKNRTVNDLIRAGILSESGESIIPNRVKAYLFKQEYKTQYEKMIEDLKENDINPSYYDFYIITLAGTNYQDKLFDIQNVIDFYIDFSSDKFFVDYKDFDNFRNKFRKESALKIAHPNQAFKIKHIVHPYNLDMAYCAFDFDEEVLRVLPRKNSNEAVAEAIDTLKAQRERLLKLHRNEPRHMVLMGDDNQGILRLNDEGLMIGMNPRPQKVLSKY